jgi:tetratricopeptide (TPR) repeat protein
VLELLLSSLLMYISAEPENHLLYSNRAACYLALGRYAEGLADADLAIKAKPDWPKAHARRGFALYHLRRYDEAKQVKCYRITLSGHKLCSILFSGVREGDRTRPC